MPEPDPDDSRSGSAPPLPRWRTTAWLILELTALLGIAATQPVLDIFGKAPEVFVEAGASRTDIVAFVAFVAFALPLVVAAVLLFVRLATNDRVVHLVGLALVVTVVGTIGVQVGRQLTDAVAFVATIALVIVAAVTIAYVRTRWLHTWLRFLSVSPLLFAAAFVVASPAGDLVIGDAGRADDPVTIGPGDHGPVVLLVLDELPVRSLLGADGSIDAERFPGFARLASESTWFRNTTAVSSNTLFAVPSIFTGQYPETEPTGSQARHHPDSLFRLLAGSYRLNVGEYVTQLCGAANCDPTDPANAPRPEYAPATIETNTSRDPLPSLLGDARSIFWSQLTGREVDLDVTNATPTDGFIVPDVGNEGTGSKVSNTAQPARFAEWLARIDGDLAKPQLSVLHTVIPHHPWRLDAKGTLYEPFGTTDVGFSKFAWLDRPGAVVTMRQRHLEMVRYADDLVDALHARLERLGIWDDTTVVVTADHGASFVAGQPFRSWTEPTQTDIVGVPLFVHGPGFDAGVIDDSSAQSVDIVPTIAGALGVRIPWEVDGVDLADPSTPRTSHPFAIKGFPNEAEGRAYELIEIDVGNHLDELSDLTPTSQSTGGGPLGTWRTGPHPELIDRPVADLQVGARSSVEFAPTGASLATTTSGPTESGVRALVVGSLSGAVQSGDVVAIALDGRVVSTATVDEDERGGSVLSAFVAPSLVDEAGHEVELFLVARSETGVILHPIDVDAR